MALDDQDPDGFAAGAERVVIPLRVVPGKAPDDEDWPEPGNPKAPPAPAPVFPLDALPAVLRAVVEDGSRRLHVPPDGLAVAGLITLAGCIGRRAVIRPKEHDEDWEERPCLWGGIVADPGSKKSPALKTMTRPLDTIEKGLRAEHKTTLAEWEQDLADRDARQKAWEKIRDKALKDDPDAEFPDRPAALEMAFPDKPRQPELIVNDITAEALADKMSASPGLTLVRDELTAWLLNISRYTKGSDRPFFLECYSGGGHKVDRVSRQSVRVDDTYLNIVGTIQPSRAREIFVADAESGDDGFLDRFMLLVYPEALPPAGRMIDLRPDYDAMRDYAEACGRLAAAKWEQVLQNDERVEKGHAKPFARFSEAAQRAFAEQIVAHERGVAASRVAGDGMAGFYAKADGLLARLSLVLHLMAWTCGEAARASIIEPKAVHGAITLVRDYFIPMRRRLLSLFGRVVAAEDAVRVARFILSAKPRLSRIAIHNVEKLQMSGLRHREPIQAALERLVDCGWLDRAENHPTATRRGRKFDGYFINPRVFETFREGSL